MRRWIEVGGLILAALLVVAAPRLAGAIHDVRGAGDEHERLYYPSGAFLRQASLGYNAPAADYAWLQATQYYGGYRRGEHDLRYFRALVDATVTLDPQFVQAYHFASLVLSMDHGDHEGALAMLKRGILHNPDDWRLHFNVGFVNYVFLKRYDEAAMWFEAAAVLPNATDFCRRFAAFSRRRGGDQEGSLILWDNLRRTTDSEDMRALAEDMIGRCRESLAGSPREGEIGPPTPTVTKETR